MPGNVKVSEKDGYARVFDDRCGRRRFVRCLYKYIYGYVSSILVLVLYYVIKTQLCLARGKEEPNVPAVIRESVMV